MVHVEPLLGTILASQLRRDTVHFPRSSVVGVCRSHLHSDAQFHFTPCYLSLSAFKTKEWISVKKLVQIQRLDRLAPSVAGRVT